MIFFPYITWNSVYSYTNIFMASSSFIIIAIQAAGFFLLLLFIYV